MSGSAFHELVESLNGADPETARALIEKPYGDSVVIPGFGTFEKRHRDERTGRNPQTGEATTIAATDVPAFKAGKGFKDRVKA